MINGTKQQEHKMTEGFTDITPPISSILTYTPAMKIGSSIIVGGIGGNFIPGGGGGSSSSMNFYKWPVI